MRPLRTGTQSAGERRSTNGLIAQKRWPAFLDTKSSWDKGQCRLRVLEPGARISLSPCPIPCNRFLTTRPTAVAREHEAQRIDVDHLALKAVGQAFPSGLRRPGYLPTGDSRPARLMLPHRPWMETPTDLVSAANSRSVPTAIVGGTPNSRTRKAASSTRHSAHG